MSKTLWWLLLGIYSFLYLVKQQFLNLTLPNLIKNHLADILFIPILMGFAQWIIQKTWSKSFKINIKHLVIGLVWTIFFFEWYLPTHQTTSTADPFDAIAYAFGAFVYWMYSKSILKTEEPQ